MAAGGTILSQPVSHDWVTRVISKIQTAAFGKLPVSMPKNQ
ncbi:hypothetical protein [Aerococcus sp. L_32]